VHNGLQAQSAYLETIPSQTSEIRRNKIFASPTEYCLLSALHLLQEPTKA
jgi:hypothetical protein